MAHDDLSDGDSSSGWQSVWRQVAHVDGGGLGQYATLLQRRGPRIAAAAFPAVSDHLSSGCLVCVEDLRHLLAFLVEDR